MIGQYANDFFAYVLICRYNTIQKRQTKVNFLCAYTIQYRKGELRWIFFVYMSFKTNYVWILLRYVMFHVQVEIGLDVMSPTLGSFNRPFMRLCFYVMFMFFMSSLDWACRVFTEIAQNLNLGILSLKALAAKSVERFSKWRKFLLTKSFVFYVITYSVMIFLWIDFPFSLRSSIFISSKQPRSTDMRAEKLSPHNTSFTSPTLKFMEARKLLSNPSYFVIVDFTNTNFFVVMMYILSTYFNFVLFKNTSKKNTSTANLMRFFFLLTVQQCFF